MTEIAPIHFPRAHFPPEPPPKRATVDAPPKPAALSPTTVAAAHEAALTARTDATFNAAHATYDVKTPSGDTLTVSVPPQFRMVSGYNYHVDKQGHCQEGPALVKALGKYDPAVERVLAGRGTPDDVAKITRTLIANGHLGPVNVLTAPAAIQAMQWRFGVGVDCAGYVQHAFFAARGKTGSPSERAALGLAKNAANENFAHVPKNPKWRAVEVPACRAGDVLLLGAPKGESTGHVVLVRDNRLLGDDEKKKLGVTGNLRRIEVDSSWGAGEKGQGGGVQRRTWLYDTDRNAWSSFNPATKKVTPTPDGPYDHPLVGIYRPKGEP